MVLISMHPFALRKLLLVVVGFLCFSAFCFADPVLMVRRYTVKPERVDSPKTSTATLEGWGASERHVGTSLFSAPDDSVESTIPAVFFHNSVCVLRTATPVDRCADGDPLFPLRKI
jgi:hypothetical protein